MSQEQDWFTPVTKGNCPNCGDPYYIDRVNGSNKPAKCPDCGKMGCSICVTFSETGTCCCSPE